MSDRVVKKIKNREEEYFITKGDNNPSEDPWIVTKDNFLGKVVGLEKKD